jgi:uncharacterized protein YcaQ
VTEPIQISRQTVRRFVLGKQGLWPGRRWEGKSGTRLAMVACEHLQLDPLVILARSHDLMLHSRVAGYQPRFFDELTYEERLFFDWGGWLAVRPMHELPYWRALMRRERALPRIRMIEEFHGAAIVEMRDALRERGMLANRDFTAGARHAVDSYRGRKDSAVALYYLWRTGEAMTHHRNRFERVYAPAESVAPARLLTPAGDDETDRGHVQHRGVVGIGMSDFDRDQLMALQGQPLSRDRLVDNRTGRNETGEVRVPQQCAALELFVHQRDGALAGVRDGVGEAFE